MDGGIVVCLALGWVASGAPPRIAARAGGAEGEGDGDAGGSAARAAGAAPAKDQAGAPASLWAPPEGGGVPAFAAGWWKKRESIHSVSGAAT